MTKVRHQGFTVCDEPPSRPSGRDVFDETLEGLEAGLRVKHIAAYPLETCDPRARITEVRLNPKLKGFDNVPVRDDDSKWIVGVLELLNSPPDGVVAEAMRPLSNVRLVSADASLRSYFSNYATEDYSLVVGEVGVDGIVTRSDMLKLPVRLLAFSYITHLELLLRDLIRARYGVGNTLWRSKLSVGRRKSLDEEIRKREATRMNPDPLELTQFCDKRTIVAKLLRDEQRDFSRSAFERDLEKIESLRNQIAHANDYIPKDGDVSQLVESLRAADRWINELHKLLL